MTSRALVRLAVVLMSTAVAVAGAELAIRRLLPQFDPAGAVVFVPDARYGLSLGPPGARLRLFKNSGDYDVAVVFNRRGLRDARDIADARAEDVVAVGDSFTFGWGVTDDERFSHILEMRAGRRVFNLAVPTDLAGYRSLLALAHDAGADIRHVVLGVCMENDLRGVAGDGASPVAEQPRAGLVEHRERLKDWLTTRSALYVAASVAVQRVPLLRSAASGAGLLAGPLGDNLPPGDEDVDAAVGLVMALATGRDTVVLIIPSRGLWLGEDRVAWRRAHARFTAALRAHGVDAVDPLPVMEAGGNPRQYYFPYDGHWNAAGHRLAGELLAARQASLR